MLIDPVTGDQMVDVLSTIAPELLNQKCLDHGFVKVLDCMPRLIPAGTAGADFALADAARISYQKGTRKANSDTALIDHLIRNEHTSPIEMGELKFHVRLPIFVMRQLVRHRTASLNEESARYSQLAADFYVPEPEHWAINTSADKQATQQGKFTIDQAQRLHALVTEHNRNSYALYEAMLYDDDTNKDAFDSETGDEVFNVLLDQIATQIPGLAREQARMILGVNIYTQCVWKMDLKNLLHCMRLRTDKHAQYEIRVFADAIARVIEALFPAAWNSFKDNFIDGVKFSGLEIQMLTALSSTQGDLAIKLMKDNHWSTRRLIEFKTKAARLGPLTGFWDTAASLLTTKA